MLAHEDRSWRGRLPVREASERRLLPRGRLVEFVRLIFVALFAALGSVGFRIGRSKHEELFGLIGM
jgi:hypothetical protein